MSSFLDFVKNKSRDWFGVGEPGLGKVGNFFTQGTQKMGANLGQMAYSPFYNRQMDKAQQQTSQNISTLLNLARQTTDTNRRQKLLSMAQGMKNPYDIERDMPYVNKTPLQILGEVAQMGTEALGFGSLKGANFASKIPGIGKALESSSAISRLGGYSALRGLEGAGYGAANAMANRDNILGGAATGALFGVAANALLSPRLVGRSLKELNNKSVLERTAPVFSQETKKAVNLLYKAQDELKGQRQAALSRMNAAMRVGRGDIADQMNKVISDLDERIAVINRDMQSKLNLGRAQAGEQGGFARLPGKNDGLDALSNEARTAVDKTGMKLTKPYGGDIPLNPDGTITVYHSTTPESAQKITKEGLKGSRTENGNVFFTTDPKGYGGIGKGKDTVLSFNIDPKKLQFDDSIGDTLHLRGNENDLIGIKPSQPLSTPKTNMAMNLDRNAPQPAGLTTTSVKQSMPPTESQIKRGSVLRTDQSSLGQLDNKTLLEQKPGLELKSSNVSSVPTIQPSTQEVNSDPVQKIISALGGAKPLSKEQRILVSANRSKQYAKMMSARGKISGEKGYFAELGALKGGAKKVNFESVRPQLTQGDVDTLFNRVNDANIGEWEKINAKTALSKLLDKDGGTIPTQNELKLLNDVFGSDLTKAILDKRSTWQKILQGSQEVLNLPRAMMASFDLSAPLRQGVFLVGRPKQWVPAFISMFKQAGSEAGFRAVQENIASRPTYKLMREARLALTDMSPMLSSREETFMSNLGEKIPLLKYPMKASNRAYTGFLNKLRADTFDDMLSRAKNLGLDEKTVAPDIAKFVNSATGRGDLGALNKAATSLNSVFFSPRLMASRINMLNPAYYVSLDPFVRKEALKSLFTFTALAGTTLGLAKAGGALVGTDPRSADFGKMKVGNTRYDILGGFQQYLVLSSRLLTGKMVSSTTGKEISLTSGYKPTTRKDIAINFLQSKENPVLSFVTGWLEGTDSMNNKFNLAPELVNRFIPMMAQDINDLVQNDKSFTKSVGMEIPAIFGVGQQTYGKQIPVIGKTPTGKSNIQWSNTPDVGQLIVNKATGKQLTTIPKDQQEQLRRSHQKEVQMKADVDTVRSNLQLQINEGQTIKGITPLPDGRALYVNDQGIQTANSPQEAQEAITKDQFDKSGKSTQLIGDTLYYKTKGGDVKTMPKFQFDQKVTSDQMQAYKDAGNYKGWMQAAEANAKAIQAEMQTLDPANPVDQLRISDLQDKLRTLVTSAAKYKSYSGFTKPKKPKKAKKLKAPKAPNAPGIQGLPKPPQGSYKVRYISSPKSVFRLPRRK